MAKNQKFSNYEATPVDVAERYVEVKISPVKHYSSKVNVLLAIANMVEKHDFELGEISEILTNNFHTINKIVSLKRQQREIANELQMITNDLIIAIS